MLKNNKRGKASVKIILGIIIVIALIIGLKLLKRSWLRFKADASFTLTMAIIAIIVILIIYIMIRLKIRKRRKQKEKARENERD